MRKLTYFILLLAFVATGLVFGRLNRVPVTIDYFLFTTDWPLAFSLWAFFLAGALVGGLVTWLGTWLSVRRRLRAARAEARAREAQLRELPSATPNE